MIYGANEKYIAINQDDEIIEIFEIPKKMENSKSNIKPLCKVKETETIIELKMNPDYLNVLLVGTYNNIKFFVIPETSQEKLIENPRFVFNKFSSTFNSAVFNPLDSHIIASSFNDCTIKFWSVDKPFIHQIKCREIPIQMKWYKNGNFLGFIDKRSIIKIYNVLQKIMIFELDLKERGNIFEFFKEGTILVCNKNKDKIYEYEFCLNPKEDFKIDNNPKIIKTFDIKYNNFLVYDNYFMIHSNDDKITLFQDFYKDIYTKKCSLIEPRVIKSKDKNILFKILDKDKDNNFKLIILKIENDYKDDKKTEKTIPKKEGNKEKGYELFEISFEDLKKDYFEGCTNLFMDAIDCLNFKYNDYEDDNYYKKEKQYMAIQEIEKILEENKNYNLIWLRDHVKEELEKQKIKMEQENKKEMEIKIQSEIKTKIKNKNEIKSEIKNENEIKKEEENKNELEIQKKKSLFKSVKEQYLFYLNLLIKDETNVDLLKQYLEFLQKNENNLEKEGIPHETFESELNYYSIFFEEEYLNGLYSKKFISEKEKFKKLLIDYRDNIKSKTLNKLQEDEELKKERRTFNQPIFYNLKGSLYFNCYITIYDDISGQSDKNKEKLNNKLYILEEIIKKHIIDKFDNPEVLIPLTVYIIFSEPKENCDFFLNSICSKTLTDEELIAESEILNFDFINNKNQNQNQNKKQNTKHLIMDETCYFNPNELCLENLKSENEICEKYNYNYLIKNPPLQLQIDKIREFIKVTLESNVFKDVFKLLTGRENYHNIFNKNMISEFVDNIYFLPFKLSSAVAFHDRLSLATFIPTMKKKIYINTPNFKSDKKIILALENGVVVALIYHEYGHAINVVISFMENKLNSINSPRKKFLKFKEGGYYMELALFGRVIKNLSYGEVLYILNKDNYSKSLEDFRNGFMELSQKDINIEGPFNDFNLGDEININEIKGSIFIKAKNGENSIDILEDIKIGIPLRNDVFGRKIEEKDLEPYF